MSRMESTKTIFVIGETGAQGIPRVRDLAPDPQYSLRILMRDASGTRAQELLALAPDRIELQEGTLKSEAVLR